MVLTDVALRTEDGRTSRFGSDVPSSRVVEDTPGWRDVVPCCEGMETARERRALGAGTRTRAESVGMF